MAIISRYQLEFGEEVAALPDILDLRASNLAGDLSTAEQTSFKTKMNILDGGGSIATLKKLNINQIGVEHNASALVLPSYDLSDQGIHPSVIDFLQDYGIALFNGYRYWMAYSPYTNQDDLKENPSILASNDKVTWVVPTGLTNPIEPAPTDGTYWADTEIVYDLDNVRLICYYRGFNAGQTEFYTYAQTSLDGSVWSAKQLVLTETEGGGSPTIFKENDLWVMYDVKFLPTGTAHKLFRRTSANPLSFTITKTECTFSGVQAGYEIWHIFIKDILGTKYCLLNTTLDTQNGNGGTLQWGKLTNDTTVEFNPEPILIASTGWNASKLYRSCFTLNEEKDNYVILNMWYGGFNGAATKIGYTTISIPFLSGNVENKVTEIGDFTISNLHENKYVLATKVADKIVTIPSNLNNPLPIGFSATIVWRNTGKVGFAGQTGVTFLNDAAEALEISAQNNAVKIIKEGVNQWALYGALRRL